MKLQCSLRSRHICLWPGKKWQVVNHSSPRGSLWIKSWQKPYFAENGRTGFASSFRLYEWDGFVPVATTNFLFINYVGKFDNKECEDKRCNTEIRVGGGDKLDYGMLKYYGPVEKMNQYKKAR